MKLFLIALISTLTLNIAYAEQGTIKSYSSPAVEKSNGHDDDDDQDDDYGGVDLYLQNNCNREVLVATRSENPNGDWETRGYMSIHPGQVIHSGPVGSGEYFLNARTTDYSVRWEGNHSFELHGKRVRAMKVKIPNDCEGAWTTVLNCGPY